MGKGNLVIGTASKKLGDIVFYRTGGEQRFRARVKPMNPRTNSQILQRCVVSSVVKYYSTVVTVCDHAFQNFKGKAKNNQRFMKLNIDKYRQIALSNINSFSPLTFKSNQEGNWAIKDDPNIPLNYYIVSEGDLPSIDFAIYDYEPTSSDAPGINTGYGGGISWGSATYADVANALGLQIGDQLTFIIQTMKEGTGYVDRTWIARIILSPAEGDPNTTVFLTGSTGPAFTYKINKPNVENYGDVTFGFMDQAENILFVRPTELSANYKFYGAFGVIVSRYADNEWRRSNTVMDLSPDAQNVNKLSTAMATYEKAKTSSLYLNQANSRTAQQNAREIIALGGEGEAIEIEEEEKPKKTRKKSEE